MTISVIATTYNRPEALHRVLEGLVGQQHRPPDEVLVADDGSGPETAETVSAWEEAAPFPILHIRQEDRGFRAARIRNRAIAAASGEYLIFLDGDCVPDPRFVDDHARLALAGTFFQGTRVLIPRERTPRFSARDIARSTGRLRLFAARGIGNRHHLLRIPGYPVRRSRKLSGIRSCNLAAFRSDLVAVNGFNEAFEGWGREDSELAVRLFRYGLWRRSHPFRAVCHHLWHPENERARLSINDRILRETMASSRYDCDHGLVSK